MVKQNELQTHEFCECWHKKHVEYVLLLLNIYEYRYTITPQKSLTRDRPLYIDHAQSGGSIVALVWI